jgi:hypothetical protein
MVVTAASERISDPLAAIVAAGQKPAGVLLHSQDFAATWAVVEATYPTWADWETAPGTWRRIEETGL